MTDREALDWPSDALDSCPRCGGRVTSMAHDGECVYCATGQVSQPDPEATKILHRRVATVLRALARIERNPKHQQMYMDEAYKREREALQ